MGAQNADNEDLADEGEAPSRLPTDGDLTCPSRTNFSFANYTNVDELCDRSDTATMCNPACFFSSNEYCMGNVYNGLCKVHSKLLYRNFETCYDQVSKYKQIWPVATKGFREPKFVFPLLSMLGPTEPKDIFINHESLEVEEHAKMYLSKGSQPDLDTAVQRKFVNKMMFFHAGHNSWINRHISELSERIVTVHFSSKYVPTTRFAKKLYDRAHSGAGLPISQSEDNLRAVMVRLPEFGNLLDIMNLVSFIPSQHYMSQSREQLKVFAFPPNVCIIDGYICYGLGNGIRAPPSETKEFYCGHDIVDSVLNEIKRTVHRIVSPLILDSVSPQCTNLLHIQRPVGRNNIVQVPSNIGSDLTDWTMTEAWQK